MLRGAIRDETLWSFFRLYVLGAQPHFHFEYKAAAATQNLQRSLGEMYFVLIMDLVAGLSKELQQFGSNKGEFPRRPFHRFTNLLVQALSRSGDKYFLFNNGVTIRHMWELELVHDAVYVAVSRDIRDQFAQLRRSNIFFNESVVDFVAMMQLRRSKFEEISDRFSKRRPDLSIRSVQFERFVLDDAYRRDLITDLIGQYEPEFERPGFDPAQSSKNIGIYASDLSARDIATLKASGFCYTLPKPGPTH